MGQNRLSGRFNASYDAGELMPCKTCDGRFEYVIISAMVFLEFGNSI